MFNVSWCVRWTATALWVSVMCLWIGSQSATAADLVEIELWPEGMPEPKVAADPAEQVVLGADGLSRRFNVSKPRLFVHLPPADRQTGAAIVIAPGGGFGRLADEHEGADAGKWLASLGVTAFQLAYRCPTTSHAEPNLGPAQDVQRSIQLVRQRAAEWKVDPKKVGLLGFSAGGQTAVVASSNAPLFPKSAEGVSHKPDLLLTVYAHRLYDEKTKQLRTDIRVDDTFPPTFLAMCADDKGSLPQGNALLFLELINRKIPAEIHVYEKGGHGFGMRSRPNATGPTDWPLRAADWLRLRGWVAKSEVATETK